VPDGQPPRGSSASVSPTMGGTPWRLFSANSRRRKKPGWRRRERGWKRHWPVRSVPLASRRYRCCCCCCCWWWWFRLCAGMTFHFLALQTKRSWFLRRKPQSRKAEANRSTHVSSCPSPSATGWARPFVLLWCTVAVSDSLERERQRLANERRLAVLDSREASEYVCTPFLIPPFL